MIKYSLVEQVMYFNYDYPPAVQQYESIKSTLEIKMKCLSSDAKRMMIFLLACYERSGFSFDNPCDFPVSVHSGVLPSLLRISQEQSDDALTLLQSKGFIEGINPHWGIKDGVAYHIHTEGRTYIKQSIRRIVLAIGYCLKCGRTERLSVDHIIPVSKGGTDDLSNLQCLCLYCNCSKRDRYIG